MSSPQQVGHQLRPCRLRGCHTACPYCWLHARHSATVASYRLQLRHFGPQSLFGIGHKAQGQLLGHEPLHQSLCIGGILLPPPRPAIRLRLCQDAALLTSGQHPPASGRSASSTVPMLPKPVSNIAQWIPSLLPRPPAPRTIPIAIAGGQGWYQTGASQNFWSRAGNWKVAGITPMI